MTESEFDRWTEDLFRRFPAIGTWLRGLGDGGSWLLADWRDVLLPHDLGDLLSVNQRMMAGDDEGPGKFPTDFQLLPAHVRRLSQAARLRREVAAPRDRDWQPDFREPRYRCIDCRDSGKRLVAHPELVSAWFAGNVRGCHYRTAVVLCNCPQADPIRTLHEQDKSKDHTATFKDDLHFTIPFAWFPKWEDAEAPQEMVGEFEAWCAATKADWDGRKRFKEFDHFNREPQEFPA